jgi:dTDP-4-amino-4,6-dideoxygalactose transaminase
LDIGRGDEVILPANTFIATALAVSEAGARPVLVDCQRDTFNLNPELIEAVVTPRTKAIMPVHLTGQAADMDPILEIARRRQLHIVEDACQAHGTRYKDRPCGSMGATGCFSFYPGKNLGAYGDGGMITTSSVAIAEKLRSLRHYGQKVKYEHVIKGTNSRLDTLQAEILRIKLKRLATWNSARAAKAVRYRELLAGVGDLIFQQESAFSTHVYHLFIIRTSCRNELQNHLQSRGIQTGIHYPIPIHLQQAYRDLGYALNDFPEAERLASQSLSLPMFPELSEGQIQAIVSAVKDFFGHR